MADQPANGTEAKVVDLHSMRDRGKAAFLAAHQDGGELAAEAPTEPAPTEKPKAAAPAPAPAPAPEPKKPAAEPADEWADDDAPNEFDDEPSGQVDPETRRRIEMTQRTESRAREQLARERAELEQKYAGDKDDAEAYRRLKAKARYAPGDVLAELDAEIDWDFASKDAYARTKEAAADPKWRDAARSMSKGRETEDRQAKLERELGELRAELKKRDDHAQNERFFSSYFAEAKALATDDSPLFARHLAANPRGAEQRLSALAAEALEKNGKLPSQKTLIRVYESRRRAELKELGVDVDALVGKKKEQTLAVAKEQATKTNSTTATSAAGAAVPGDRKASRAAFLKSDVS